MSEDSDVPRTRADAVDELRDRGLVDVRHTTPRQFWAISTGTPGRHFDREYTQRVNVLTDALGTLKSTDRSSEQRGVWTVTGRDAVTERVLEFVGTADEEIAYVTVDDLLTGGLTDGLRAASERGVSIRLAEMSQSTRTTLRDEVPGAESFDSLWDWSETPAGRLLAVDQEKTLTSLLVPGAGDHPPEPRDETAIWGTGPTNSPVVVLRAMFARQLDGSRA